MNHPLQILIVEDSEDDAELALYELHRAGYEVHVLRVETAQQMQAALEQQSWDAIISDYNLPKFSGLAALNLYKEKNLDIPFIVISGAIGENTAVEMMRAGVHDYLIKGNLARLAPAIDRELREAEGRRQRRLAEQSLIESEEKFSKAFRISPDAVNINRLHDGLFIEINQGFTEVMGYTVEDTRGKTSADIQIWVNPADRQRLTKGLQEHGEVLNLEAPFRRKDGSIAIGLMSARVIELNGSKCILSITREITERKKAEEELQRLNRSLTITNQINQVMVYAPNEADFIQNACRVLATSGGYRLAWIRYWNKITEEFGNIASIFDRLKGEVIPNAHLENLLALDHQPAVEAIHTTAPVLVQNLPSILDSELAIDLSQNTLSAFPLVVDSESIGILFVLNEGLNSISPEEVSLLNNLSKDLAFGIHSLRARADRIRAERLLERSNAELELAYDATLEGWSRALEMRERETAGHSQRVVSMTISMAKELGISGDELIHIRRGALLHDIGKMGIPDSILLKPGPLTDDEWIIMRQHPTYSYNLLHNIPYLRPALDIPYCHHERWDGSGYPNGLQGESIPIAARIFTLVDVWDALSSDRPYRPAWPPSAVRNYMLSQSGKLFDPNLLALFMTKLDSI